MMEQVGSCMQHNHTLIITLVGAQTLYVMVQRLRCVSQRSGRCPSLRVAFHASIVQQPAWPRGKLACLLT